MDLRTSVAALVLFGCADRVVEDDAGGDASGDAGSEGASVSTTVPTSTSGTTGATTGATSVTTGATTGPSTTVDPDGDDGTPKFDMTGRPPDQPPSIDCDEPYLPVETNTCEVEPLSPGSGLVQAGLTSDGADFGCLLADDRQVAAALSACLCDGAELVGERCGPYFYDVDVCCYWSLFTSEC